MAENGEKRHPTAHRTKGQMKRDNAAPEAIARRAETNKGRSVAVKAGIASKGDGKDVHHVKPQRAGGASTPGNLKAVSPSRNRGWRDGV